MSTRTVTASTRTANCHRRMPHTRPRPWVSFDLFLHEFPVPGPIARSLEIGFLHEGEQHACRLIGRPIVVGDLGWEVHRAVVRRIVTREEHVPSNQPLAGLVVSESHREANEEF